MTINIQGPELKELKPRILVLGVGGAGGNAINGMIDSGMEGVEFVAVNTDAQDLISNKASGKIQLGANLTKGLGAGAKHEIGQAAAEESLNDIIDYIKGSNMVFITAGMGGGTGTGASHVIARAAKELNILTVGVVTLPFSMEGPKKARIALQGLEELKKHLDANIVVPNQNLFKIVTEKTTFKHSFGLANNVLKLGVQSVTDLMVKPGLVNLDFADVETIMKGMGKAMMGTGEAEGEKRAEEATNAALLNPLIDEYSLRGAKGLLVNITGGTDLTLFEVEEAVNKIRAEVDPEAELIFGAIEDENLNGKIRVSIVATALDGQMPEMKSVISMIRHINTRSASNNSNKLTDVIGTSNTLGAIEGATALDITKVPGELESKNSNQEIDRLENGAEEVSLESATYLQNLENAEKTTEEEIFDDSLDASINQDLSLDTKNEPNLFSDNYDESKNLESKNESEEPEMFESQDDEEDFEIPAFLRRQKN